jgi:nucleoid-associated protein YgaU
MQKDMKIGMFVGLILAGVIMVYVCTRPSFSPKARMLRQNQTDTNGPRRASLVPSKPVSPNKIDVEVNRPMQVAEQTAEPLEIQPQPVKETALEPVYVERTYETRKFYIVRKGDTLSKISKRYYGTSNKWYRIYEANRDVLENPDMLKPGLKLHIPN